MNPTLSKELAQGEKSKLRNEARMIIQEVENKTMEECRFAPQINEYEDAQQELTQEERWRRLLEPKTTKIQQLEKTKAEKETKEVIENCSFKPNIAKPPQAVTPKDNKETVHRLHSEANKRLEKREKLKRKVEEERMKE